MKKILLATTALAMVSGVSGAMAQESAMMSAAGNEINIGGYYEFGYASFDDDGDNTDDSMTYGDSELFIDFERTGDNGLTYGVQIDLEIVRGNQHGESGTASNAEESSLYVRGDFGTLHFGHDDNAYGRFLTWAPTHEGAISQDDAVFYPRFLGRAAGSASAIEAADARLEAAGRDNGTYDMLRDAVTTARQNLNDALIANPQVPANITTERNDLARAQANIGDSPSLTTDAMDTSTGTVLTQTQVDAVTEFNEATAARNALNAVAPDDLGGNAYQHLAYSTGGQGAAYDDGAKITYVSPTWSGFSFGVSWEEDGGTDDNPYAIGASYNRDVAENIGVTVTAAYYDNDGDGSGESSDTQYGVAVNFGPYTATLSRYEGDRGPSEERETTEIGVGWTVNDKLSVGASWAEADNDHRRLEGTFTAVSGSYNIATGLKTTLAWNSYDLEDAGNATRNNDGDELVWQLEFSF